MDNRLINELKANVPGIQHYNINENGLPRGDWFVFETSPVPSPIPSFKQLKMIIADIDRNSIISLLNNGTLEHSANCKEQDHKINIRLKTAAKTIINQKFRVAVWENTDGVLGGQPVVIPLDPEINYNIYPDHPHLNAGGKVGNYYLPESICYTDDPPALGNDPYTRTEESIEQTYMWLFKHQVWLATRNTGKKGEWIGPQVERVEKEQFIFYRNPYGKCWCGSNKEYYQCHLNQDFKYMCESMPSVLNKHSIEFMDEYGNLNLEQYNILWEHKVKMPQNIAMARLKRTLQ